MAIFRRTIAVRERKTARVTGRRRRRREAPLPQCGDRRLLEYASRLRGEHMDVAHAAFGIDLELQIDLARDAVAQRIEWIRRLHDAQQLRSRWRNCSGRRLLG